MSLRLSTGFCRGMTLDAPPEGTRPTAGKVRAAVWNSLQTRLAGSSVLDVFAGSGAVGIEALSRGALAATFVENGSAALKALRKNLAEVERRAKSAGETRRIDVRGTKASEALPGLAAGSFDILWLDPPYAIVQSEWPLLDEQLARIARDDAVLVVECAADELDFFAGLNSPYWTLVRQRNYGKVGVSTFEKGPPA